MYEYGPGSVTTELNGLPYFSTLVDVTEGSNRIRTLKYFTSPVFRDAVLYDIRYREVTKKEYSGSANNTNYLGKTVSTYKLPPTMAQWDYDIWQYYVGIPITLETRKVYDKEDRLLKNESYNYTEVSSFKTKGYNDSGKEYEIYSYLPRLESTQITEYDQNGLNPIINTTTYRYDGWNRMVQSSMTKSNGGSLVMYYDYPVTGSTLWSANMINIPIYTQRLVDGKKAGIMEVYYNPGYIRPSRKRYSPTDESALRVIKEMNYEYYSCGNLLYFIDYELGPAGIITVPYSIIYSYNNQFPIAIAKGINYSDLMKLDVANLLPNSSEINPSEDKIISGIETLNDRVGRNASVMGMAYKPLVGITTLFDELGRKTKYNYNEFGQLESIVGDKGNTVKQFEYNVKNK
ncbi:MAG: hypothetical protein LUD76_09415 [Alistipes sp.]|nr:hypothetical protein [Alistipes sp.]